MCVYTSDNITSAMQQTNLRIEKSMRSNFRDFAIFEYNKLVTPLENYLSVRSLQRQQKSDMMLPIPENVQCLLSLKVCANNRLLGLQKLKPHAPMAPPQLQLVKFEEGDRKCMRLSFKACNLLTATVCGDYVLYAMESHQRDFVEMQLVDSKAMKVKATGFMGDRVKGIEVISFGESMGVSVLLYSGEIKMLHYIEEQPKGNAPASPPTSGPGGFMTGRTLPGFEQAIKHRYVNSQFMVCSQATAISIYMDYTKFQHVNFKQNVSAIEVNSFGVFVYTINRLMYFRQKRENFQQEINIQVPEIDICKRMEISPSDTLLLLYSQDHSMVSVWIKNQENNRNLQNSDLTIQVEKPRQKELVCVAASPSTSYLATLQKTPFTLNFYDLQKQGQPFISYILSQQQSSVSDCCFHPLIPLLAVSYRNQIKIYCIMYSGLRQVRQLPVARAKKLIFSSNGGLMACVVGKDKGTKLILYEMRGYTQVETLWVGGNVLEAFWSTFDNAVYVVSEGGFLWWGVDDTFKERREVYCPEDAGKLLGGFYDKTNKFAVAISQNLLIRVGRDNTITSVKTTPNLTQIFPYPHGYLMSLSSGNLLFGPTLQVGAVSHHRLSLFRRPFTITRCNVTRLVCTSSQGQILVMCQRQDRESKTPHHQIVLADKNFLNETLQQLRAYERDMRVMSVRLEGTVDELKREFQEQQKELQTRFQKEMLEAQQREGLEREQKHLLEKYLRDNSEMYEKQQFKALGELQKLYQRKIVLTTNKLLTSQEIAIRNQVTAQKNLKQLDAKHDASILMIREAYLQQARHLNTSQIKQHQAVIKTHQEYQQRIAQIQSQYQSILRDIQIDCDSRLREQKRMNIIWENRYTTCQSEKQNLEQAIKSLKDQNKELLFQQKKKEHNNMLMERKVALVKRDGEELQAVIKTLEDRIAEYQYKVKDLEKAKEILTFRVLETRNLLIPKEQQLSDFQAQFVRLEEEFDKTLVQSQENLQRAQRLKKDLELCRKELNTSKSRQKASKGQMQGLVNKIYQIVNHSSPEQWNRNLLKLYEQYCRDVQHKESFKYRSKNTVEELNRVRVHLQHCLDQVITSNVKIQERKAHQFTRKTHQNAQLLKDINELRRQLKRMKEVIDQKNHQIQKLKAQQLQSSLNGQRRIKTQHEERRHSKFSDAGSKTFYQSQERGASSSGFSKFLESSQSKRVSSAQKGASIRRGRNFSKCFRIDTELNKKYEQEDQLKEARRQLQLQEQLIVELKTRLNSR